MFTPGHSFGLVALEGLAIDAGVPAELHLDPSRSVVRGLPLELELPWRERLGVLLTRRLERTSLAFVATEADLGPGRGAVLREAEGLFTCLQLVGFVRLSGPPLRIGGDVSEEDGPVPAAVAEMPPPIVLAGSPAAPLGWVELGFALRLRQGLRRAEAEVRTGLLERAIGAFVEGTRRHAPDLRIHEFVRALEVLVAPTDGVGARKAFARRTRLFFDAESKGPLRRMYRAKERAGHGRDVLELYAGVGDGFRRRVELWRDAVTAETLVRGVLQRLVLTPTLWEHFRDEESMERFWAGPFTHEERVRVWGRAIPVAEARASFRDGLLHPSDVGC